MGTNLLLAYALQLAVLGDFYPRAFRRRFALASGAVNAAVVAWLLGEALAGVHEYAIDLGGFGGFHVGETVLILDSIAVTALLYTRRARIPERARPLLHLVAATFAVGLGLASASGSTVHGRFGAYHALWHVVGAFGFLLFWAFNHVRFEAEGEAAVERARPAGGTAPVSARSLCILHEGRIFDGSWRHTVETASGRRKIAESARRRTGGLPCILRTHS